MMGRFQLFLIICLLFVLNSQLRSENVIVMQSKASTLLDSGRPEEASKIHETIVSMDSSNFESNAWLGNYYFLRGAEILANEDKKYNDIRQPTSMQTAIYIDELKKIYYEYFLKAEPFVKKALNQRTNDYLSNIASTIDLFKIRIGIEIAQNKKQKRKIFKNWK